MNEIDSLSSRELEILALLAGGLSNKEIAERLVLAPTTVKWYNHQLFGKLRVTSRRQAIERAIALRLVGAEIAITKSHLPAQTTPFIGREAELRDLARLLNDSVVRLVTILASGGMGKSRLALEAAGQQEKHFANGAYFIPLAPLGSFTDLIATIANHIGFCFFGADEPKKQLLNYLRSLSLLLVLDNFEHLLDGAPLIAEMIEAAPHIKILVTSREKLNLSGETVYTLGGMTFPEYQVSDDPLAYDAARLFVQSARRLQPDFSPKTDELPYLTRVSYMTQGMPLGIILAAAWVDVLTLPDIVSEINRSLEVLQQDLRDIPARHRSIQAVFDPTWERLTDEQRTAFMKLCVFQGGFTRDAARRVANADLHMLHIMVGKSLIQADSIGRYNIHELLRQYGEKHLDSSGIADLVHAAHSAYFMDFLAQRDVDIKGRRQLAGLREISVDFENIRRGWFWAVEHQRYDAIQGAINCLMNFAEMSINLIDVRDILRQTVAVLARDAPVWDQVAIRCERMNILFTTPVDQKLVESILARARERGNHHEMAYCHMVLGFCALVRGDHPSTIHSFEECLAQRRTLADEFYIAEILLYISNAYGLVGPADKAEECLHESISIRRKLGDQIGLVFPLVIGSLFAVQIYGDVEAAERFLNEADAVQNETMKMPSLVYLLGTRAFLAFWRGDLDEALRQAQAGLDFDQERNWDGGRSYCLSVMSMVLSVRGDYVSAQALCEEALSVEMLEFITGWPNCGLALASCGLQDYSRAHQCLLNAIQSGTITCSIPDTLISLPVKAFCLAHDGNQQYAVEILGFAFSYPSDLTGWMYKWRLLTEFRAELEAEIGSVAYAAAWMRGSARDLKMLWAEMQAELEAENQKRRML